MIVLALDTCFAACSVALGRIGERGGIVDLLAHRFELPGTGHAERLAPMLGEVMGEAGLSFGEISVIAVTVGPGSFTGVRIAVAAARALALATGARLATADSLVVMRETAARRLSADDQPAPPRAGARDPHAGPLASHEAPGDLVVAIDARRGQLYCLTPADGGPQASARLTTVAALAGALPSRVLIVGSGGPLATEASRDGMPGWSTALPDLVPDARDLLGLAPLLALRAPGSVAPLYLRPPDAKPQASAILARLP